MSRPRRPAPPTDQDKVEGLVMQDRWRRERYGITMDGAEERARELVASPPKPPAFEPAPTTPAPTTRKRRPS